MPDVFKKHAGSIGAVMTYLGTACPTFRWKSVDYQILPNSARFRKDFSAAGGFRLDSDLKFTVLASSFDYNGPPALKETITYPSNAGSTGRVWRVDSVTPSPGGYQYEIECNDPNAGA